MSFFNLPIFSFLKNGTQTPVSKDTANPANSNPLPVELSGASGDVAINAANLHMEVQTSHTGTDPDSMQIGNGTYIAQVTPDGELQVAGSIKPSGLNIGGRISQVALNTSTWTALPASPLANRNALAIQNISGIEIKIQYDNATVGYSGLAIASNAERYYDITDSIVIYAKAASGTPSITVEEIA
jgi:hypothetical protein